MEREQTHTPETRIAHWLNAALVLFLVWTGFSMFAGDRHFIAYVRFLPSSFWHAVHFAGTRRQLFSWHTIAGAFFALNGIIYAISLVAPGALKSRLSYHLPQRAAYASVMAGALLMVFTGALLWLHVRLPWLLPVHIIVATTLILFVAVHVVQVLRAGPRTLLAMTVGNSRSYTAASNSYTGHTS
jgi:thiosulfate reductase cytochrome b subunit